jgi:hypothetical protein
VIHGIHVCTAYLVVLTGALHLIRVFATASYKTSREVVLRLQPRSAGAAISPADCPCGKSDAGDHDAAIPVAAYPVGMLLLSVDVDAEE